MLNPAKQEKKTHEKRCLVITHWKKHAKINYPFIVKWRITSAMSPRNSEDSIKVL